MEFSSFQSDKADLIGGRDLFESASIAVCTIGSMSEDRHNLSCKVASMTLMKRWLGRRVLFALLMPSVGM